jgi:hypothetical protein
MLARSGGADTSVMDRDDLKWVERKLRGLWQGIALLLLIIGLLVGYQYGLRAGVTQVSRAISAGR